MTTANAIAHPDTVIKNNGSIFHLANSTALTVIPFCRNIARHNNPAFSFAEEWCEPARLAENVNDTAPMFEPTANANIPAVSTLGGRPGRFAKLGCLRILTRRIVAPIFVPETLQRMTLITPTTQIVAGMEKPTTIASHVEKTLIHPVYESASTRMNWENAKGKSAYGNLRDVAEKVGNLATKAFKTIRSFVMLNRSLRYVGNEITSDGVGPVDSKAGDNSSALFKFAIRAERRVKLDSPLLGFGGRLDDLVSELTWCISIPSSGAGLRLSAGTPFLSRTKSHTISKIALDTAAGKDTIQAETPLSAEMCG